MIRQSPCHIGTRKRGKYYCASLTAVDRNKGSCGTRGILTSVYGVYNPGRRDSATRIKNKIISLL